MPSVRAMPRAAGAHFARENSTRCFNALGAGDAARGQEQEQETIAFKGVSMPSVRAMPRAASWSQSWSQSWSRFQCPRCGRCRARLSSGLPPHRQSSCFNALGAGDAARGKKNVFRPDPDALVSMPSVRAMPRAARIRLLQDGLEASFNALGAGDAARGKEVYEPEDRHPTCFNALGAGDAARGGR